MPDWFYRTVTQPLLFRLPAVAARDFTLGFMGRLARLPFGPGIIDFLGHMRADPRLGRSFLGIDFPTAVGLGPGLDGRAEALPALARFGFGFLDIGPIALSPAPAGPPIRREDPETIWSPDPPASLALSEAAPRLAEAARCGLPLIARIRDASVVQALSPHVDLFALEAPMESWAALAGAILGMTDRPLLLCLPADLDSGAADPFVDAAVVAGISGLLVDGSVAAPDGGRRIGLPAREPALAQVRHWRQRHENLFIVASGGIHEPEDALAMRAAGADLVEIDSGVVYSGPGLPKRINDALLFESTRTETVPKTSERAPERTWFWTMLMGAGMLFGSLLALAIAMTRVVLPYDEAFVGLYVHQLTEINPRLLEFMAHDRVSLAGTMVAIGAMYLGLSLHGVRRGLHWAQQSIFISSFGFASFFLFLGFGYLDTFHAFVTAILFQFLLMALHSRLGIWTPDTAPLLRGDRAWRRGLWGQLLLVIHGFGLLGAGATISAIGVTGVFVKEDLEFMHTTAEALTSAHARLVPLVAHDRATLGGMLLASGWVFLLPVLWGFRNGSAWLWWTMLVAGCSAYAAALGIHLDVGYMSLVHLLPAFGGLALLLTGLGLSYSWLCGPTGRTDRSPASRRAPRARAA